jgi:hypothetical protein
VAHSRQPGRFHSVEACHFLQQRSVRTICKQQEDTSNTCGGVRSSGIAAHAGSDLIRTDAAIQFPVLHRDYCAASLQIEC